MSDPRKGEARGDPLARAEDLSADRERVQMFLDGATSAEVGVQDRVGRAVRGVAAALMLGEPGEIDERFLWQDADQREAYTLIMGGLREVLPIRIVPLPLKDLKNSYNSSRAQLEAEAEASSTELPSVISSAPSHVAWIDEVPVLQVTMSVERLIRRGSPFEMTIMLGGVPVRAAEGAPEASAPETISPSDPADQA